MLRPLAKNYLNLGVTETKTPTLKNFFSSEARKRPSCHHATLQRDRSPGVVFIGARHSIEWLGRPHSGLTYHPHVRQRQTAPRSGMTVCVGSPAKTTDTYWSAQLTLWQRIVKHFIFFLKIFMYQCHSSPKIMIIISSYDGHHNFISSCCTKGPTCINF